MSTVLFGIVSYEMRRDIEDPLRFMEVLKPVHFFQRVPYHDVVPSDAEGRYQFNNPADLYLKLGRARPQIVQGGEPFVRRLVPIAWAVQAYATVHRRPYVVPSVENLPLAGKYGGLWAAATRAATRRYVRGARLTIAVNAGAAGNLAWAGAAPERMVRMMYGSWGVDTAEFSPDGPRAALPGGDVPKIVFLGRIVREKGVFDLVAALPAVLKQAKAALVFIGDGADAGDVRKTAADAGVAADVHFVSTIRNADVAAHLRAAAVLAAPSLTTQRWAEQVGMSAMQALACGLPVVSTRSGSIPEFIDDGASGLLVPEGSPAQLANALTRLLTDEPLRRELAGHARAEALRRFDARTNVRAAERRILEACGFAG